MAKMIQFEGGIQSTGCLECEASRADWLDGTLTAAEQARFDQHVASCATCNRMASEAQRGAAWLEMLRTPRPEPRAELLERILASTSAVGLPGTENDLEATPAWQGYGVPAISGPVGMPSLTPPSNLISFGARLAANQRFQTLRYNLLQPRLAMTAAMAFFSVALTLNLAGVRLNEVHASNLTPTGLRRTFYDTSAKASRYYGNLKVVYVMESRLEDLRKNRDDQDDAVHPDNGSDRGTGSGAAPKQNQQQDRQQEKKQAPGPGTSRKVVPQSLDNGPRMLPVSAPQIQSTTNRSREIAAYPSVADVKPEFDRAVGE